MQGICWNISLNPIFVLASGAVLLKTPIFHGMTVAETRNDLNWLSTLFILLLPRPDSSKVLYSLLHNFSIFVIKLGHFTKDIFFSTFTNFNSANQKTRKNIVWLDWLVSVAFIPHYSWRLYSTKKSM